MAKIVSFDFKTRTENLDVDNLEDVNYFSTDSIAEVWPAQLRIKLLTNRKPQDYFPVVALRIVSSRFVQVCKDFDVNAEFLPIQLLERGGSKPQQKYYFCHLLDMVDCFDFKNSKVVYRDKKAKWIDEVKQLAIHEKKNRGPSLVPGRLLVVPLGSQ